MTIMTVLSISVLKKTNVKIENTIKNINICFKKYDNKCFINLIVS